MLSFSAKPVVSFGSTPVVVSTGVRINPLKAVLDPLCITFPDEFQVCLSSDTLVPSNQHWKHPRRYYVSEK